MVTKWIREQQKQFQVNDVLLTYEGHSKINLRLVGKNKRVVIVSKRTLRSNKQLLFLLYAYPQTFSLGSVGVNSDKTWRLPSPLPPAVSYVLWLVFFTQKDKARPRFIIDCVVYTVTMLWVTVVWGNGAENLGMGGDVQWRHCSPARQCAAPHRASHKCFNLLVPELFFLILAHPVYKMWIIQETNMLELWNKMHFEEKKTESIYHI